MTNARIIFDARCDLMEKGIIGTTGRSITVETNNGAKTLYEPEEIHTFQVWKSLGYSVKKGEHAIAKFAIWKYVSDRVDGETESEENEIESGHCIMKVANFFKFSQVEKK